jgi:hypothetical protein
VNKAIRSEFQRGPVAFVMNAIQILLLAGGIGIAFEKLGYFKAEFSTLQKTVEIMGKTMRCGFEAQAAENCAIEERRRLEDKKLENAIVDHTGKSIR